MSIANKTQVGGNHYRGTDGGKFQHWDLVEQYGIGYLEGCATKYVSRWRRKNGVVDLEKAGHFIDKLIEMVRLGDRKPRGFVPVNILQKFSEICMLDHDEELIISLLCTWHDVSGLVFARDILMKLESVERKRLISLVPSIPEDVAQHHPRDEEDDMA